MWTTRLRGSLTLALIMTGALLAAESASYAAKPAGGVPLTTSLAPRDVPGSDDGLWVHRDLGTWGSWASLGVHGETTGLDAPTHGPAVTTPGTIVPYEFGDGYWIVTIRGHIEARGDAPELCGGDLQTCSGYRRNDDVGSRAIVAAAATPTGRGIWAVQRSGQVWTAGDAVSYGDVVDHLNPSVFSPDDMPTGIAPTPSGRGYTIVAGDGGVFTFGDAQFFGSFGGKKPGGRQVTGIALSRDAAGDVNGYWLVADDGGVFTFGAAPFLGSTGGNDGGAPVTSITALPEGGYAWVHADGRVGRSARPTQSSLEAWTGVYQIRSAASHGLLRASSAGAGLDALGTPSRDSDDGWRLEPADGRWYWVVDTASGLVADVSEESAVAGAAVIGWTAKSTHDARNQLWRLEPQPDGSYVLRARYGGQLLTVSDDGEGRVVQMPDADTARQRWFIGETAWRCPRSACGATA